MVDWDGIVSRDGPAVWRTLYRLLGNSADAEDCFQETFLAALKVWRRESVTHPQALLHRLATARALDRLRKRYRRRSREGGTVEWEAIRAAGALPVEVAQAGELSERLRQALTALPAKQAQAFCLFYLEGWDYQQIAPQVGASVNAVGVLLHRARHRLRELLRDLVDEKAKTGR